MLEGVRPGAELLAVVAHGAEPLAVLRGGVPEIGDDLVDLAERDAIAEPLLRAEDRQQPALVVGRVRPPHRVLRDGGRPEVGIVDDRRGIAGRHQGRRQVGFPDPLGEPGGPGPLPDQRLDRLGHARQLLDPVPLGERGEDRFEVPTADDLHLSARGERPQQVERLGPLRLEPFEERAGVVQGKADRRVTVERLQHRQVGALVCFLNDPAEVPDRLVIVEREGEADLSRHRTIPQA